MNIEIIIINSLNTILVPRAFHPGRGEEFVLATTFAHCVRPIRRFFRVFVSDIRKGKIAAKFQSLKTCSYRRYEGIYVTRKVSGRSGNRPLSGTPEL